MQQPRAAFNPCLFQGFIYLSGFTGSGSACDMEVFSPEHDSFLPFQIPLPENHNCCVYVDSDLLVLHSYSFLVKFEAGENGQLRECGQIQVPNKVVKYQNSQTVVNKAKGVFCILQSGQCLQFSMETGLLVARI